MMRNLLYITVGLTILTCLISCHRQAEPERILLADKVIPLPETWKTMFKNAQKIVISDTIGTQKAYVQIEAEILTSGESHFISKASLYSVSNGTIQIKGGFTGMPLNSGDKERISMFLTGDIFFSRDNSFSKKMTSRSFVIYSNGSIEKKL